jgi:plastocyanin
MHLKPGVAQVVILAFSALLLNSSNALQAREQGNKKPSLSLKASPSISFAPARIVVVAELKGGDDEEELYCPTVEWEWGDLTQSVVEADCEPYSPGKSEIKRRYTVEHQFKNPGSFKIVLRLKKGSRIVGQGTAQVQVRAGLGQEP